MFEKTKIAAKNPRDKELADGSVGVVGGGAWVEVEVGIIDDGKKTFKRKS